MILNTIVVFQPPSRLLNSNNSYDAQYIKRCCEQKGVPYKCMGLCIIKGSVSSKIVLSKHEYECDEYDADIEKCIEDGLRPKGKLMV